MVLDPKSQFQKSTDVSRETMEQLEAYAGLLEGTLGPADPASAPGAAPEFLARHMRPWAGR
mgnify:CR=1 FL=1